MSQTLTNCKPTLVLIHGWGVNHAVWLQISAQLAGEWLVLALDLPGYGLATTAAPNPYTLQALADQLADQIPAGSYVLGWSLGGLVATEIALRHSNKVKQLGLLASSPCFMQQSDWPGMSAAVLQQFADSLSANLALTVERFLAIQSMGSSSARQDTRALKQAVLALPLPTEAVLSAGLQLLQQTDLRDQLVKLPMPVTWCLGRLDSLVPSRIANLLLQYCPQAQVQLFDKASHAPFISHQAEFIQWLHHWVNGPAQ